MPSRRRGLAISTLATRAHGDLATQEGGLAMPARGGLAILTLRRHAHPQMLARGWET